jgi:hypothetical protein
MYGALHCKFGCGSRRMRNIRWSGGSGDHQMWAPERARRPNDHT